METPRLAELANRALARNEATPFYIFDVDAACSRFAAMQEAWSARFGDRVSIACSYKTNPLSAFTTQLRRLGAQAEVVCGAELEWALADGHVPEQIYFDGPVKTPEEIRFALDLGVRLQIDSVDEGDTAIALVAAHPPDIKPRVSLRLAVPRGRAGDSRFGLLPAEFADVRRRLTSADIEVDGIHVHAGMRDASPRVFAALAGWTAPCVRWLQKRHGEVVLDLGGGFPSRASARGKPIASDLAYASAVHLALQDGGVDLERIRLVLEPGRSLSDDHGALVTRVVVRKHRAGSSLLVVDAGSHLVRSSARVPGAIRWIGDPDCSARHAVFGSNCFESDLIAPDVAGPEVVPAGSALLIEGSGGYDLSSAPAWIRPLPAVLVQCSGELRTARRRQGAGDLRSRDVAPGAGGWPTPSPAQTSAD